MEVVQLLVGYMDVYAYLIGCPETKKALVIDPGGDSKKIKAEADKKGWEIIYIVNTHIHPDHTADNAALKALTGAKLLVHKAEAQQLVSREMQSFSTSMGCAPSPGADEALEDNQVISLGPNCELKVLHTPGHSPGGICLYFDGHVFTGDTLFVGAVGRTDFPGGSWPLMLKSIQERILTLPPDTVVWPGHHYGPTNSSTVQREAMTNPFLQ